MSVTDVQDTKVAWLLFLHSHSLVLLGEGEVPEGGDAGVGEVEVAFTPPEYCIILQLQF